MTAIERVLRKMYLDGFVKGLAENASATKWYISWHLGRKRGRVDRALIERYFAEHEIRRLHIGCGTNILPGWLNSDAFPVPDHILHLDATVPFPFADGTLDCIFSEHMIEHISYPDGAAMLRECHRVLKDNGKIRISTPDLRFLIDLYGDEKSTLQKRYIEWITENVIKTAPYSDATFVINNFVRHWGHLFIYDDKTLRASMENAGFGTITRHELNESGDAGLRNLENEKRMPPGFVRLESLTLEGTKGQFGTR